MPKVRQITDELPTVENKIEETPQESGQEAVLDLDENILTFTLSCGKTLTMREPRAIDFLKAEDWRNHQPTDERGINSFIIKLASLCLTPQISYQELSDSLETFEDLDLVQNAVYFFRDRVSDYFNRLAKSV